LKNDFLIASENRSYILQWQIDLSLEG